jgi:hypothetical protein
MFGVHCARSSGNGTKVLMVRQRHFPMLAIALVAAPILIYGVCIVRMSLEAEKTRHAYLMVLA